VKEQDSPFGRLNSVSVYKHTAASGSRVLTSQNRLQGAASDLVFSFHKKKKKTKTESPLPFLYSKIISKCLLHPGKDAQAKR